MNYEEDYVKMLYSDSCDMEKNVFIAARYVQANGDTSISFAVRGIMNGRMSWGAAFVLYGEDGAYWDAGVNTHSYTWNLEAAAQPVVINPKNITYEKPDEIEIFTYEE